MKDAFLTLGRGVGQVMFQNNALSGVLMLAGILLNSWQMALLAIAGNVVSTLTACLSGYSREDIRNGLYGFNGTLVGIAIGVFMPVSVASFSLLVAGACLSAWIARLFSLQRRVPGFTAPFIRYNLCGNFTLSAPHFLPLSRFIEFYFFSICKDYIITFVEYSRFHFG